MPDDRRGWRPGSANGHARQRAGCTEVCSDRASGASYSTVKRWAHERRREERARARACVRFETAPGLESQFDWKGPVTGLIIGAPELAVHFFRFVLAWSRARWTLVAPDLKAAGDAGGAAFSKGRPRWGWAVPNGRRFYAAATTGNRAKAPRARPSRPRCAGSRASRSDAGTRSPRACP